MKIILYPKKESWSALCRRPGLKKSDLDEAVRDILFRVKSEGDKALLYYNEKFDGVSLHKIKVSPSEISEAVEKVPEDLKNAINFAKSNIEKFHSPQLRTEKNIETCKGVNCWRKNVAIEKVGLYIPGGSAPLFSTVLMLAIPARIAGCKKIVMCTPPDKEGKINPVILYTAQLTGVSDIFKAGGAQAIAAMAYGTESLPAVNKIFGPGNQYVTKAKELIQQDGLSIDLPAGPSEVLIIADKMGTPEFIAADLLSQAEHGADSQVLLITDNETSIDLISKEIKKQLKQLPRKEIAAKALKNSIAIGFSSLDECIEFSNQYAPEHLIINTSDPVSLADRVINAGSVFLGNYSCESAGDYASGTNHTLPTNGFAMSYSGVSTDSFLKKITFQKINKEGIKNLGPAIELMAEAERLSAHKKAITLRLKSLENG
jgi:histidinol dehydrogenase